MELMPETERVKAFLGAMILGSPGGSLEYRYSDFLPERCSLAAFVSAYLHCSARIDYPQTPNGEPSA